MTTMFGPNQYNQGVVLDTGWMTLDLADITNFSLYGGQPIRLRQVHRTVHFTGALNLLTAGYIDSTTSRVFITLAPEYRPTTPSLPVFVCQASSTNRWCLRVNNDGTCSAERHGPAASTVSTWLPFNVSWLLD